MHIRQKKFLRMIFIIALSLLMSGCATTKTLKHIGDGHRYVATGQFEKALGSYEKTLSYAPKSIAGTFFVAAAESNIGATYMEMGKYGEAMKYFNQSLRTSKGVKNESNRMEVLAANLNNIALLYLLKQDYDSAIKYSKEALAINKKMKRNKGISLNLGILGMANQRLGRYDKAVDYYKQALGFANNPNWQAKMDSRLLVKLIVAQSLLNIGWVYYEQGSYPMAIEYVKQAAEEAEKLRAMIKFDDKLDYQVVVKSIYQLLTSSYVRTGDFSNAFESIERGRTKLLAERLVKSSEDATIPSIRQIQEEMDDGTAIIIYANADLIDVVSIVITKDNVHASEISVVNSLIPDVKKHEAAMNTLLESQRGLKFAKKERAFSSRLIGQESDYLENTVNYYHTLLYDFSSNNNRAIRVKYKNIEDIKQLIYRDKDNNRKQISRILYNFLIKPTERHIKGKERLIVIPDGMLAFLPFEALIDGKGQYLVENYRVKYVQSMSILDLIRERKYKGNRKPLLAFGGAVYDEVSYDVDMVSNVKQLEYLAKNVFKATKKRGSVRNAYAALGYGSWSNLPGTLDEVKNISKVVKGTEVITGDKVSEKMIIKLSKNGELAEYKVIHIATHGFVVPSLPELSAVVLSQFNKERGGQDGYLRMEEIAELKIEAEFVNLSACETGLGKIYSGEGVIGLTQSFLIAGANSISSSLWKVADISTSQFMVAMYELVEKKEMEYSDAITEVKRRFIKGEFGDRYKEPYYWAPFVYYGK